MPGNRATEVPSTGWERGGWDKSVLRTWLLWRSTGVKYAPLCALRCPTSNRPAVMRRRALEVILGEEALEKAWTTTSHIVPQ